MKPHPGELARLPSVIKSKRDRALCLLAYRHGLRASKLRMLRISDIDFDRHRSQHPRGCLRVYGVPLLPRIAG
jgi:integrase